MDVVLFPQVNPDGRRFSMERHPMWRKNRRPAPRGRGPTSASASTSTGTSRSCGVFDRYFAPDTVESSFKPGDYETYVGPREASEPETKNVIWLLDRFPNIRYLVRPPQLRRDDPPQLGHRRQPVRRSADELQESAPTTAGAGLIHDHVYREYMPTEDQKQRVHGTGQRMAAIPNRSRAPQYRVQPVGRALPDGRLDRRLRLQPPLGRPEEGQDHRLHHGVGPQPRADSPSIRPTRRCARSCERSRRASWRSPTKELQRVSVSAACRFP